MDWVDCFIDKWMTMFPKVASYAALVDRWAFVPVWGEAGEVDFDLTRVHAAEDRLMEMYGIRRRLGRGRIDDELTAGNAVLLPCDLYDMPHAKVFYRREHANHYVLVRSRLPNGRYRIYDDFPAYEGEMEGVDLLRAHESLDLPYQVYLPGEMSPASRSQEVRYLANSLSADSFRLGEFAESLLNEEASFERKCRVLVATRHMQHRLYGLKRLVLDAPTPERYADEVAAVAEKVTGYIDGWRATVNLAAKGIIASNNDTIRERTEQRLIRHCEGDALLRESVHFLRGILAENDPEQLEQVSDQGAKEVKR